MVRLVVAGVRGMGMRLASAARTLTNSAAGRLFSVVSCALTGLLTLETAG